MTNDEIKTLQLKANLGDIDAQRSLGCAYMFGDYGEVDYANAWRYFSMAAKQKDAYSTFICGYMRFYGCGMKEDCETGVRLWELAAEYGSGDATEKMAICYEDGIVVPQNTAKAKELWHKAAMLGMPNSMFNCGADAHNNAIDSAKAGNWEKFTSFRLGARLYLEKAAMAGSKEADELLRDAYGGYMPNLDDQNALNKKVWNQIRGL